MPKNQIKHLEALCLPSDDPRYLLAKSVYNLRLGPPSVIPGQNIASTLFAYQGNYYSPIAAVSRQTRQQHGERLSLLEAIKRAVKEKWGPFESLTLSDIPDNLSIENIRENPRLLGALKSLDYIQIYSERDPCDYRRNLSDTNSDKGCEVYLQELRVLISAGRDNIYIYHSIQPFSKEEQTKEQLEKDMVVIGKQQPLFHEKQQMINEKIRLNEVFNERMQPLKLLLAEKQKQYGEQKDEKLLGDIQRIQVVDMKKLRDERDEKLATLNSGEAEINERLKVAFGLSSPMLSRGHEFASTSTMGGSSMGSSAPPPIAIALPVGSSSSSSAAAPPLLDAPALPASDFASRLLGVKEKSTHSRQTYQDPGEKPPMLTSGAGASKRAKGYSSPTSASSTSAAAAASSERVLSEEMTQREAAELHEKLTDAGIKSHLITITSRRDDPNSYQIRVESNDPSDIKTAREIIPSAAIKKHYF